MNDKLLILEDTNGDGKADKCTRLRRRPAQPDRLRVLERRRARRPGARPAVPQGHRRRRQGRRARARLHGLDSADTHHTANSFVLDPGGALYFQEGTFHHTQVETPYGPPVRCANAGVFRYEPRTQKFDVYVCLRLRQSARPRLRPLGPGHRRRRHRARTRIHARPLLRPRRLSATSTPRRRRSTSSARGPAPASRFSPAGTSPSDMQGNLLVGQRDRLPGHPAVQGRRQGRQLHGDRARADPLVERSELPPGRLRDRPRRRASTSSTGTTRSSATCSTTCAIPAATASMAASIA